MTQAFNLAQLANNLNTSGQLDATDGLTGLVANSNLASSGTADSTTFLRGDRTWASIATGKLLQIQQTYSTTRLSTTTDGYSLISCSITPSSTSSKIYVMIIICTGYSNNNGMRFYRNGTELTAYEANATWNSIGNAIWGADEPPIANNYAVGFIPINVLDSPASTSAQTYEIKTRIPTSEPWYFNRDANNATESFGPSSITLMEIGA